MAAPGFWADAETSQDVIRQVKSIKAIVEPVQALLKRFEDAEVMLELGRSENDAATLAELDEELVSLHAEAERVELMALLSGPNDEKGGRAATASANGSRRFPSAAKPPRCEGQAHEAEARQGGHTDGCRWKFPQRNSVRPGPHTSVSPALDMTQEVAGRLSARRPPSARRGRPPRGDRPAVRMALRRDGRTGV